MEKTVAPANVSPFIKVFTTCDLVVPLNPNPDSSLLLISKQGMRWTLLLAGIIYGSSRYNMLYRREQKKLAELERTRPEREAKQAAERKRITEEQIADLGRQLGSKI